MRVIKFFFTLIITLVFSLSFQSCEISIDAEKEIEYFKAKHFLRWIAAIDLQIYENDNINSNAAIIEPQGVWLAIAKIDSLQSDMHQIHSECLFYKTPYSANQSSEHEPKTFGLLKVVAIPKNSDCRVYVSDKALYKLNNISDFKYYFAAKRQRIGDSKRVLEPFTFYFSFKRELEKNKQKVINYTIPLHNIRSQKITGLPLDKNLQFLPSKRDQYAPSTIIRKTPGLLIFTKPFTSESINQRNQEAVLQSKDSLYIDRTLTICHQVDDACNPIIKNRCNSCPFNWFEGVGSKCSKHNTKFCGPNNCGKKGEPACFRGYSYHDRTIERGCYDGSEAAFCNPGLKAFCDENNVMVCL